MTVERFSDADEGAKVLRLPALEVTQGPGRLLYTFAVDGKLLSSFAAVSRIRRDEDNRIEGYQRHEVLSHIASIRRYLESEAPMIPNALVVAFDKRVQFEAVHSRSDVSYARQGTLVIPIGSESDGDKPGWIVDGQQRSAAIREARIESFPLCVTAFITDDEHEQRSQFILVNSTKPLPKGLIYELLPTTVGTLPKTLQSRKFPSVLLHRLNGMAASPFYRKIQTPTTPEGIIKDNSVLKMLETSLSDGALYTFRDPETGNGDEEQMLTLLIHFWSAVSEVFSYAWPDDRNNMTSRKSRLVHGVGIASMGLLMDAIYDRYSHVRTPTKEDFVADLKDMKDVCKWTNGTWDLGPGQLRKWNELQNTTRDIQLLTNYILQEYKNRVWRKQIL